MTHSLSFSSDILIEEDIWLSNIFACPVYKINLGTRTATGDDWSTTKIGQMLQNHVGKHREAMYYVHVDTRDIELVRTLCDFGMYVVDVNVTHESDAHSVTIPSWEDSLSIGEIRPNQYQSVLDIASTCFRVSRFHLDPLITTRVANQIKNDWIQNYIDGKRGEKLLVACLEERPVGFLAVLTKEEQGRRIKIIDLTGVNTSDQGQGIGRALASYFIHEYSDQCDWFRVGTQIANIPAMALYSSLGFAAVETKYLIHMHVKDGQVLSPKHTLGTMPTNVSAMYGKKPFGLEGEETVPTSNNILGLNAIGFNTSSALLLDGEPVFAVEEERLTREKRTRKFPINGVSEALKTSGLRLEDLEAVAIAWNPAINLESFSAPHSERARHLGEVFYSVPNYLMRLKPDNSVLLTQQVLDFLDGSRTRIYYVSHHLAHASNFFFSPFEEAAIMTVDAFGEKHSLTYSEGHGNKIRMLGSQEFPHSLGAFYSTMTELLGFQAQSDEWKLMGASSYGDSERYYDKLSSLIQLKDDGLFELDLSYFNFYLFHRPHRYTENLCALLGLRPNVPEQPLIQEYYDLAAAAQRVTEDIYFHAINYLHSMTGLSKLVLAGGVALNSVANGKLLHKTPFKEVFIPPCPDDSGAGLGAAFYVHHHIHDKPRQFVMEANYYGPGYTDESIQQYLQEKNIKHRVLSDPATEAARLIASWKIIAWFQGRLEFGDRALGNRSILADPRDVSMKDRVNETVKYREPFRPFAPSILLEFLDEYFVDAVRSPYMENVFPIRAEKQDVIPAVVHVDGTGRPQTVTKEINSLFWQLIDEFRKLTGVPLVLNTSFNLKGEPIVSSPQDALRTFFTSGLDALVIGNCLVEK